MALPRILSGIQPTGNLHLGNYLGAIRNWVDLQRDYECMYCMVDLHAITEPQDPDDLRRTTREGAATLLAAGIDPERSVLFVQSQVAAHAELAWILTCTARMGWLQRMTQFKDKAGRERENASVGLFVYPTLMAADILVYGATHVPVGEDQRQHLELCRDIAQSFNRTYGRDVLPLVEPLVLGVATRVMSLRDGTHKMSKSDPSDMTRINLTDPPELVRQKIRKARTDAAPLPGEPAGLADRPEARNLVGIYAALTRGSLEGACREFAGAPFSRFKEALAETAIAELSPIAAQMRRLSDDPGHVQAVLAAGAARARERAAGVLREIHDTVGFLHT